MSPLRTLSRSRRGDRRPGSVRALRRTQLALVLIILGYAAVGRSFKLYPITTWPMYSRRTTPYPGQLQSRFELRVIERATGQLVARLDPVDLVSYERNVAPAVIRHALGSGDSASLRAHRAYLLRLVRIALPGVEIDSVEAWRLEFEVEPLELPPLWRERPAGQVLLGVLHPAR